MTSIQLTTKSGA